jgi:hypothetical protein
MKKIKKWKGPTKGCRAINNNSNNNNNNKVRAELQ